MSDFVKMYLDKKECKVLFDALLHYRSSMSSKDEGDEYTAEMLMDKLADKLSRKWNIEVWE